MKWNVAKRVKQELTEQLLFNRGIKTKEEKSKFFNPMISDYESDLKIDGIEKSVERIKKAIKENEQICIYGDYDADGVCASAVLYKALTSIGAKAIPYIPHREKEGYGISNYGLDFVKDSGATLVITVDNGIVAINQAEYAKKMGIDLIITDHHVPSDKMPDAYSIVHSTKMCGTAVAWCLVKDIIKKDLTTDLLELVAIATVCDLIPLTFVNRAFVYEGLKILNNTKNLGLRSLIKQSGVNLGEIGTYEIGHILGPRINAIGRLEHAIDALRLFCTKDETKAKRLAKLLSDTNQERQHLTIKAIEEARMQINMEKKIHILVSEVWQPGIIGLIAGRITDEYSKPTIAISISEEMAKGSARSVGGVNIVELIRTQSEFLIDIGGHPGAAGFSLKKSQIAIFKKSMEDASIDLPEKEKLLELDAEIIKDELTKKLFLELKKMEPFGFGNPKPIFVTKKMQIFDMRTVGNGRHLKFKSDNIDAIAFNMGDLAKNLKNGQFADIAFHLDIDNFTGVEKLQLKVKDIKIN